MLPHIRAAGAVLIALFWVGALQQLRSQCQMAWVPQSGAMGVDNDILAATMWDPDGPGPAPPRLVIAGLFQFAGSTPANLIAAIDPATGEWSALGSGLTGALVNFPVVWALATLPNGTLVAGGNFTNAGGVPVSNIASWNGTSWSALGSGRSAEVYSLKTMANGTLLAGGSDVASWDGTSWSSFGSIGRVWALETLANGDVVAGGDAIARWNGTSWSSMGGISGPGTPTTTRVISLALLPNGNLVAGGNFTAIGGVSALRIASWDGTSWSPLQQGLGVGMSDAGANTLRVLPNGDLLVAGYFWNASNVPTSHIARWNGTSWSAVGQGINGSIQATVLMPNGDIVAGGLFTLAGGVPAGRVARWDGSNWSSLDHGGVDNHVLALMAHPSGDLVIAGTFTHVHGVFANRIARWDGTTWSAFGSGLNWDANALTTLPNGDIVVAGDFTTATTVAANRIARWNGVAWSALGSGLDGHPTSLTALSNGSLVVAGDFTFAGGVLVNGIALWNGSSWSALGSGIGSDVNWLGRRGSVSALAALPNGGFVAVGNFSSVSGVAAYCIAQWNGSSWSALGPGLSEPVYAVLTLPNGDVVAPSATPAPYTFALQRWNGATWSPMGSVLNGYPGVIYAMTTLPDGDIVAARVPFGIGPAGQLRLGRLNGTAWSDCGGFDGGGNVLALAALPSGDLFVGGSFQTAGGFNSPNLARLTTTCPAAASPFGQGCNGPAGPVALRANSLPWTGSTYAATGTGLSANSVAVGLFGFSSPGTPLSALHPAGIPGCNLLASPDLSVLLLPAAGVVVSTLPIPDNPVFVGTLLKNQIVQVELDPLLGVLSLSSSNALALTVGTF